LASFSEDDYIATLENAQNPASKHLYFIVRTREDDIYDFIITDGKHYFAAFLDDAAGSSVNKYVIYNADNIIYSTMLAVDLAVKKWSKAVGG